MPDIESPHPLWETGWDVVQVATVSGASSVKIKFTQFDIRTQTNPYPPPDVVSPEGDNRLYVLNGADEIVASYRAEKIIGGPVLVVPGDVVKVQLVWDGQFTQAYGYYAEVADAAEETQSEASAFEIIPGAQVSITSPAPPVFAGCDNALAGATSLYARSKESS